jgi:hypothetical protein
MGLLGCNSDGTEVDLRAADALPDTTVVTDDARTDDARTDDARVPDAGLDASDEDVASLDARSRHDAADADANPRDSAPETAPVARDARAEADSSAPESGASMDAVALHDRTTPLPSDSALPDSDATSAPLPDGGIPSSGPGDLVDFSFSSVAPNATPGDATPLGTSALATLVVWVGANPIGGPDGAASYFVFQSAPDAALFEFNMCFAGAVTAMTASLWLVQGGAQVLPPVATWTVTDTCGQNFATPLDANTTYLFGVEATGGPGTYTA